jgi:hypothetical protein
MFSVSSLQMLSTKDVTLLAVPAEVAALSRELMKRYEVFSYCVMTRARRHCNITNDTVLNSTSRSHNLFNIPSSRSFICIQ